MFKSSKKMVENLQSSVKLLEVMMMKVTNLKILIARIKHNKILALGEQQVRQSKILMKMIQEVVENKLKEKDEEIQCLGKLN